MCSIARLSENMRIFHIMVWRHVVATEVGNVMQGCPSKGKNLGTALKPLHGGLSNRGDAPALCPQNLREQSRTYQYNISPLRET